MRDCKPQRCVQQHKSLKVTRNATDGNPLINEAAKQIFAKNLFKISCTVINKSLRPPPKIDHFLT